MLSGQYPRRMIKQMQQATPVLLCLTIFSCGNSGEVTATPESTAQGVPTHSAPPAASPSPSPTQEDTEQPNQGGDPLQWEATIDVGNSSNLGNADGGTAFELLSGQVGDGVFYMGGQGGLIAIDPSYPSQPTDINQDVPRLEQLALQGDRLFAVGSGQVLLVDVQSPLFVGRVETQFAPSNGYAKWATPKDDLLFVTATDRGLLAYDIAPGQVSSQGLIEVGNSPIGSTNFPMSVAIYGSYALVTDSQEGLLIFDVSNARDMELVAQFDLLGSPRQVLILEDTAYITLEEQGVAVIDIFHATAPVLITTLPMRGRAHALSERDGILCIAGDTALEVWDVSQPTDPLFISNEQAQDTMRWCGHSSNTLLATDRQNYGVYTLRPQRQAPEIHLESTFVTFEGGSLGETLSKSITVYNDGPQDLEIDQITIEPWYFSVPQSQFIVPAQGLKSLDISYTVATDADSQRGTLQFFTNDPDELRGEIELLYEATSSGNNKMEVR